MTTTALEDPATMGTTTHTIPASDGHPLEATLYANGGSDPDRFVVIDPATAVVRRFYDAYARYLAEEGFTVLTFDVRGVGGSAPDDLRSFEARMEDWGRKDLAGVLRWAREEHDPDQLNVVGHSSGGQLMGLAENVDDVDRALFVAAGIGYWGLWPFPRNLQFAGLFYLVVPIVTRMAGYFPARRLAGWHADLPPGIARQWAAWCRHPDYMRSTTRADGDHYEAYTGPLLALSFEDDHYAPPPAVDGLLDSYVNAQVERRHIGTDELGPDGIGHFGFFKPGTGDGLWAQTAAWLDGR